MPRGQLCGQRQAETGASWKVVPNPNEGLPLGTFPFRGWYPPFPALGDLPFGY